MTDPYCGVECWLACIHYMTLLRIMQPEIKTEHLNMRDQRTAIYMYLRDALKHNIVALEDARTSSRESVE